MSHKKLNTIKPEIRVLGLDDGMFIPRHKGLVSVVGVVFRGGYWLEGVMQTKIEVDGIDATNKIASMIVNSPHYRQLRVIMLYGVTFGGFNVVNIQKLNLRTRLPVIIVSQEKPNFKEIRKALENLPKSEVRWRALLAAGKIFEVATRNKKEKVYIQLSGISQDVAKRILRLTSTRSKVPEALRVAHLVASGTSDV